MNQVISYDVPSGSAAEAMALYAKRLTRSGRPGKTGIATAFVTAEDVSLFAPLKGSLCPPLLLLPLLAPTLGRDTTLYCVCVV